MWSLLATAITTTAASSPCSSSSGLPISARTWAGKTFGKHKLAPKISPGKTWEGWAGGVVLTLVVGWALKLHAARCAAGAPARGGRRGGRVRARWAIWPSPCSSAAWGVKDSGRIMPGHGGLLDRFDAFLLVLPVLALLQLLF